MKMSLKLFYWMSLLCVAWMLPAMTMAMPTTVHDVTESMLSTQKKITHQAAVSDQKILAEPQAPIKKTTWLKGFEQGAVQHSDKSNYSGGGRLLAGMLIVIGLIFGLAFFIKKAGYPGISAGHRVRILSMLPLGSKEKLLIVQVYNKRLLLGVTAHNIRTLEVLEEVDAEEEMDELENPINNNFYKKWLDFLSAKKRFHDRCATRKTQDVMEKNGKIFSDYIEKTQRDSAES